MKEDCPNYRTETKDGNSIYYCVFRYWGCYFQSDDPKQCQFYEELLGDKETPSCFSICALDVCLYDGCSAYRRVLKEDNDRRCDARNTR